LFVLAAAALTGTLAPLGAVFAATGLASFALAAALAGGGTRFAEGGTRFAEGETRFAEGETRFAGGVTRFAGAAALACALRTALAGCFAAEAPCAALLGRAVGADFDLRFRGIAVSLDA